MTEAMPRSPEECPPPPVPSDCDLRGFGYMSFTIDPLRMSRTWLMARATHEISYYLINLVMACWHQVPASSLPDDDLVLANQARCAPKRWEKVRNQVLQDWTLCNDGRLYHPAVAEHAARAWETRCERREKLAVARRAKEDKRTKAQTERESMPPETQAPQPGSAQLQPAAAPAEPEIIRPDTVDVLSERAPFSPPSNPRRPVTASMTDLRGKGERENRERRKRRSLRSPRAGGCEHDPLFEQFMERYPCDEAPRAARREWDAALERGVDPHEILEGLARYRFREETRWIKYPANWLAGECWRSREPEPKPFENGFLEIIRGEGMPSLEDASDEPCDPVSAFISCYGADE